MKIIYVSVSRLPTEKAYGVSTVKIAEAFASEGIELELIIPVFSKEEANVFDCYNIKKIFKIKRFRSIDLTKFKNLGRISYFIKFASFSLISIIYILVGNFKSFKEIFFFSHENIPLYFLSFFSKNIFYDIHDFQADNFINRRLMKKAFGFSVQTKWKIEELSKKFNIDSEKIVYWPNGTDFSQFKSNLSKEESRSSLGLPRDKKIIVYTGQLFSWKGTDTLIKSIDYLDDNFNIYLVGGAENDISRLKKELPQAHDKRIFFIPFQLHKKIPIWMRAADVLALPNTAREKISLYYTSPMKLFEYMLIGRPIVASAIPSIMEILNNDNSLLVEADNPKAFAEKIKYAIDNPEKIESLINAAQKDVSEYTWENRAKKIIEVFNKHQSNL